jgi:hypothetical protein
MVPEEDQAPIQSCVVGSYHTAFTRGDMLNRVKAEHSHIGMRATPDIDPSAVFFPAYSVPGPQSMAGVLNNG